MTRPAQSNTRLQGRKLLLARLVWLFLAVLAFAAAAASLPSVTSPASYTCPKAPCFPPALSPADQANLADMGLSLEAYATYFNVIETLPTLLAWLLVAVLIFWRKSDDPMAILTSIFLMTFITALSSGNLYEQPGWLWVLMVLRMVGPTLFVVVFFIFPDGRFVPRWTRWFVAGIIVEGLTIPIGVLLPNLINAAAGKFFNIFYFSSVLVAFGSQVYRYKRVSTPVQRQQTKWILMAAFMMPFSDLFLRGVVLPAIFPWISEPSQTRIIYHMITIPLLRALPFIMLPVAFGIAILRYRLWDIDVLIRRTLVYTLLTGVLAIVYISTVLLLQEGVRTFLPTNSPALIVVSTLAVAALFNPLRVHIQAFIDRRFYRQKYDAEQVLGTLSATLRDEVDLEVLAQTILGVVDQTMQPANLGIWMREKDDPRISGKRWSS